MRRDSHVSAIWVLVLALLSLTACDGMTVTPSSNEIALASPAQGNIVCESCAQLTMAAESTQQKNSADIQAAATAEIVRANAQATLNSANATLYVAQTQQQGNADVIAAQIAATSQIILANAQATLNSAGSTQMAAQTQAQYDLQVTQAVGTQSAEAMLTEQIKNDLAANTQTAIANTIATQSQSAAATSQWYSDQGRQREEQRQGPIAFLWMWCLPIFIVVFAILVLWGVWRWLSIQQANQRILVNPEITHHHHSTDYIESDIVDGNLQLTADEDHVDEWIDEVKGKLLRSEEKEDNDNTDS